MEPLVLKPIASDARGDSWSLYFPELDAEMVIIRSKKGAFRGAHSHDKSEVSMTLAGKIHYHKMMEGKEIEFDRGAGQVLFNDVGEVHMAEFLEDTTLIDWKINCKVGEAVTTNFKPWRDIVDEKTRALEAAQK